MSELRTVFRRAGWLLAAVPFFGISTGALFPLVALELDRLGFGEGFVGFATSLYYAGSVTGALTYGWVLTRLGYKAGFLLAAILASVTSYALTQSDDPIVWLGLRFFGGYALGAYYVVVDSWVSALGTRNTRGRLFATYETLRLIATAIGPSLIVIGATSASISLVACGYVVSFVPALLNGAPAPKPETRSLSTNLTETARCFPFALTIAFCGGVANASFYGLSAIYAKEIGFDNATVALFVGIVLVAPAISEIPIGALADRFRRMPVAAWASILAAAASLTLALWSPSNFWLAATAGVLVGGSMVPLYALGLSRIVDAVGEQDAVPATTVGLLAYNVGAMSGPAVAGFAMQQFGPSGLYLFITAVAIVAAISSMADTTKGRCCPEQISRTSVAS